MEHISEIIDDILTEWAYRVNDGMPDVDNPLHMAQLEHSLFDLEFPGQFIVEFMSNLREADTTPLSDKDKEKAKKLGLVWKRVGYGKEDEKGITHKNIDGKLVAVGDEKGPEKEPEKPKEPEDKEATKDFFKSTYEKDAEEKEDGDKKGKEEPTQDKITPEQKTKEKKKTEEISKVLDLFTTSTSETKGSGKYKLSPEDVQIYEEHLNLSPEERIKKQQKILDEQKKRIGKISDEDIDMAMDMLKEKLGPKAYASLVASIKKKGDPPPEFTKSGNGKERLRNVIRHYLQTGGISAISGKVVPFSDSQLDHVVSLDNGGKDGAENWEWMESRFNQFKGARSEKEVKAKLIERGMRTESEVLLEMNEDELKQYQDEQFVAYWETKFEKGDVANLSVEAIKDMTADEITYLTKAWNNYVGENDPRFIPRYGDRKTVINGKKMTFSRGGVVKPDKKDRDTWGWKNEKGKWVRDPELAKSFEASKAAHAKDRGSGGQKITADEIKMKLIGGTDEVTGQVFEGVLKTGDGYPPIPDEDEEQDMDSAMREMLEYKLNKKAIIDKYKEDRKNNPKSSSESGKRVTKALKSQTWFRKWSDKEKKKNPEEYKKWEAKKDEFVLNAWQKELENR